MAETIGLIVSIIICICIMIFVVGMFALALDK